MRPPLFLLVALAALSAQARAQERPPLTPDQEAALYGLPVVTSASLALLLVNVAEDTEVVTLSFLVLPLAASGVVCGAGRLTGAAGSCRGAFVGGGLGALPGLAMIGMGLVSGVSVFDDGPLAETAVGLILLGAASYVLLPPFTAAERFRRSEARASAVVLRTAAGATVPGAGLTLRF